MERERLVSLDAFRGLTIGAMILVNNPGEWGRVYWPLDHAPWHGWTPTDLIFPFFLFMVGMALPFSQRTKGSEALRRTLVIAGLGIFMAAYPYFDLATVRIPGVLVRIAVCYFAAWWVHRLVRPAGQGLLAAFLLVFYWYLMTRVPVPDGTAPNLDPGTNLGAWVDRQLLSGHLWKVSKTWDPEGLLSTLPAIATTLLGLLAGSWLRSDHDANRKTAGLLLAGVGLVLLGLAWSMYLPHQQEPLDVFLRALHGRDGRLPLRARLLDRRRARAPGLDPALRRLRPQRDPRLRGLGSRRQDARHRQAVTAGGRRAVSLQAWLHRTLFASWLPPCPASLAYAVANVLFWYAVLRELDRRGIYLKV